MGDNRRLVDVASVMFNERGMLIEANVRGGGALVHRALDRFIDGKRSMPHIVFIACTQAWTHEARLRTVTDAPTCIACYAGRL